MKDKNAACAGMSLQMNIHDSFCKLSVHILRACIPFPTPLHAGIDLEAESHGLAVPIPGSMNLAFNIVSGASVQY